MKESLDGKSDAGEVLPAQSWHARVFTVRTRHATSIGFTDQQAAQLVHGVAAAQPAMLLELPGGIYLMVDTTADADRDTSMRAPAVIALQGEAGNLGSELVSLRHPAEARYLSAHAHSSLVTLDRSKPLDWEQFTLIPASGSTDARIISAVRGIDAYSTVPEMIIALAKADDMLCWAMAAALLQFPSTDAVKSLVADLQALRSYAVVFPSLRRRLSGGRERFEFQVSHLLASQISKHGWNVGDHSYGNPRIIEPHLGQLTIGKYCSMNDFVIILGNHAIDRASSYPFAELARYWPGAQVAENLADHVSKDVVIGNDVWIGNGVLVLPGTVIGDGAVIGAHAVARGNIPPYSIVVGNPGRVVRRRFDQHRIDRLLALSWWNWPDHKVDRFIPYLLDKDVDRFLELAAAAELHAPSAGSRSTGD